MKRSKKGFTLVELIVVITILGILAGVGTVAYSGYIKKANQAADEMLLSAVNRAFAAACIENGTTATEVSGAKLTGTGAITGVTGGSVTSGINTSFLKYFAGNESVALRSCTPGEVQYADGVFFLNNDNVVSALWNGLTLYLKAEDLNNIKNSDFVDDTGVGTLLGQVNAVVNLVQSLSNKTITAENPYGVMTGTVQSDEFMNFFANSLGVEKNALIEMISNGNYEQLEAKGLVLNENSFANAMILYAASNSAVLKTDEYVTMLASGNAEEVFNNLVDVFKTGAAMSGEDISKAACIYGMDIALKNYNNKHPDDPIANIAAFMQTDAGKANLAAYTSSMDVITDNLNSPEDAIAILNYGIDENLINALNQAMGIG